MTNVEYAEVQHTVIELGNLAEDLNLVAALERISQAQSGAISPLMACASRPRLDDYVECLRTLQEFRSAFEQLKRTVRKTEPAAARIRDAVPGVQ